MNKSPSMVDGRIVVHSGDQTQVLRPVDLDCATPLSELLRRAGLPLNTRCGGRGRCDGCLLELCAGGVRGKHGDPLEAASPGSAMVFRGCEYGIGAPHAEIRIPVRSSMRHRPQIVDDFQVRVPWAHNTLVSAIPGRPSIGAAVDIGTTTVAILLLDLADGRVLVRASRFNEQMHFGEDVLTRINLCSTDPAMLGQLQEAVARQTILPLLHQAMGRLDLPISALRCVTLAGNTTMLHLLAGVDPSGMGISPFMPVFLDHRVINAAALFGQSVPDDVPCHLLPSAAAYVGADLTVGIVATGLLYDEGPSLLVDVGTNGEIILKHGDELLACATAAGPAFEGAGLSSGMRAAEGAVSHVRFDPSVLIFDFDIIGDGLTTPFGICGSGYVDFLASARQAGLLSTTGRFDRTAAGPLQNRLIPWEGGRDTAFRLADGPGKQPIVISQRDIASLLQAKAAIAAGTLTLLQRARIAPADIRTVYLAGGFGTHMDAASAIACGLLPGFTPQQIRPVGNTSLGGAMLCLADGAMLDEACVAARRIRVMELNQDPGFEACYIDQLPLE